MGRRTTRLRLSADELQRMLIGGSEDMKPANDNSADVTTLKPCDHQAFFEVLDSPPSPTEALRAAFRRMKERSLRQNTWLPKMNRVRRSSGLPIDALSTATPLPQETTIVLFDQDAFPALWTLQYHHFQRTEGLAPSGGRSEDAGPRDDYDLRGLPKVAAVYFLTCRRDQALVLRTGV